MDINYILIQLVVFIIPLIGVYFAFHNDVQKQKSDLVKQENRLTLMEKDIEHLKEQVNLNVKRLDNHDEQNRVLIALTEQVKNLSEDIKRIEKKLEKEI